MHPPVGGVCVHRITWRLSLQSIVEACMRVQIQAVTDVSSQQALKEEPCAGCRRAQTVAPAKTSNPEMGAHAARKEPAEK
jgi:hypothetical protein